MIRAVLICALVLALGITAYLPAIHSPDRFVAVVQAEHRSNIGAWGFDAANRVLARALEWSADHRPAEAVAPIESHLVESHVVESRLVDQAMLREVNEIAERFTSNRYFQSVDALLVLAAYRASIVVELTPLLLVFVLAVGVDAFVVRSVRTKELVAPSGEAFGASMLLAVVLVCSVAVGAFVPIVISPIATMACLLAGLFMLGRALANYPSLRH